MNILLLSAYDAYSHRYWREGLVDQFDEHDWVQLVLPARHFSWRVRGNCLTWAKLHSESLQRHYDLIIATSMVDLSSLRGMVPALSQTPTILYFHENQFAYPPSKTRYSSVEPQITSLYSALCADKLVFNSAYNHSTFMAGARRLLKKLPDGVPKDLVSELEQKAQCLAVPLTSRPTLCDGASDKQVCLRQNAKFSIVWNHRWEYDKGPEKLYHLLMALPDSLDIRFHVLGQRFRRVPDEFEAIKSLLQNRNWLGHWGYIESRAGYFDLLNTSHLVLSTSLHDFQGLSVLDAASCGLWPVVPNRLAYPEIFGRNLCYQNSEDSMIEAEAGAKSIVAYYQKWSKGDLPHYQLLDADWTALRPQYEDLLYSISRLK